MIEYLRTPARSLTPNEPPDAAAVDSSSRLVFLSGVQAWDEHENFLGGDAGQQMRVSMVNIERILRGMGGSLTDLVKVVIYVVTRAPNDPAYADDYDSRNGKAWWAYVDVLGGRQPPTTIVGVSMLGGGLDRLVEVEAIAALP